MKKIVLFLLPAVISFTMSTAQNNRPKITPTLNHTAIYVTDLLVSTHFYQDILGLDTIPEPFHDGRHAWFSIGNKCTLHIIQGAAAKKEYFKSSHTCFNVPSVSDFITLLKANKVEYENLAGEKNAVTTRVDGVKQIYFKDPDGYWLEINDAKE